MKIKEREQVKTMRLNGCSYGQIASLLKIPKTTIASFCQTKHLVPEEGMHQRFLLCQYCGELFMPKTRREQSYCSGRCRNAAWRKDNEDAIASALAKRELAELDESTYDKPVPIGRILNDSLEKLDFSEEVSDELDDKNNKVVAR